MKQVDKHVPGTLPDYIYKPIGPTCICCARRCAFPSNSNSALGMRDMTSATVTRNSNAMAAVH